MDNLIFLTLDILLHSSVIHVHVVVAILYGADPAVPFARRTASLTEHEASCAGTTGCHAGQQPTEDKQQVVVGDKDEMSCAFPEIPTTPTMPGHRNYLKQQVWGSN